RLCYDHSRVRTVTAGSLPGQLACASVPSVPRCQRSFTPPAFFHAVNHHFCCRAVAIRPRAPLLVTMSLLARSDDQAARAKSPSALLWLPRFTSLSYSGRIDGFQSPRRNRSAPCQRTVSPAYVVVSTASDTLSP